MLFGYPLGIILILISAVIIFFTKEEFFSKNFNFKKNTILWLIFIILGGSFFSLPLPFVKDGTYVNVGGALIPLIIAFYLLGREDRWERTHTFLAAMVAFILSFVVFSSIFIPLSIYLPLNNWLMPYLSAFIVFIIAKRPMAVLSSLILGLIGADIAKAIFTQSYIATEIGNRNLLNNLILATVFAYVLYRIAIIWTNKQSLKEIRLTNHPQS